MTTNYKLTAWINGLEQDAILVDRETLNMIGGCFCGAPTAINVALDGDTVIYVQPTDGSAAYFLVGADVNYFC